jgi:PadR family transcriptional regulator, regulatory protein AphA
MSLKHAILGFLYSQSLSGYDLKKAFDESVRHFWLANQSQIYRTLAMLNEEAFVEQEVIEREDRIDKKIYHITEAGKEELENWLSKPLAPTDYREPFLIQLYFGGILSDDALLNLLQHEIKGLEEKLAAFKTAYQIYKNMLPKHENQRAFFLKILTLEFGLVQGQANLEWLRSAEERIEAGEYDLEDF